MEDKKPIEKPAEIRIYDKHSEMKYFVRGKYIGNLKDQMNEIDWREETPGLGIVGKISSRRLEYAVQKVAEIAGKELGDEFGLTIHMSNFKNPLTIHHSILTEKDMALYNEMHKNSTTVSSVPTGEVK